MNKIIVAVDGSEHAERAVEKAREICKAFNCSIVLINVVEMIHHFTESDAVVLEVKEYDEAKKQSKDLLAKTKAALEEIVDKVETVMLEGNPSHELVEYIESSDADLVILGSHGAKGLGRFMLGSVVSKVIHHADKSVLIVR